MNNFTYEHENNHEKLETYEWDNVWWEHADKGDLPRVLYIGDSISCGTRRIATETAKGKIYFDGFGTSKALDNPYLADSVRIFTRQQGERRVIFFNNGLHGWHLDDKTEYAREYEKMIKFLTDEFKGTPLVLLLTTCVADPERDKRVTERNRVASELASKYNLSVIDLYSITKSHSELLMPDGVHWCPEGYQLLADELVKHAIEYIWKSGSKQKTTDTWKYIEDFAKYFEKV